MAMLPDMSSGNVTVIGDVMLDRFWSGGSRRISPEAPVPVVNVMSQEDRAGGAGNVAVNLAHLGIDVSLVGLCGEDDHARALRACVEATGVRWNVMPCGGETIVKLRVLSRNQQLLRMDFESPLASYGNDLFVGYARQHLADADLVVFSDYAKGSLSMVDRLLEVCREMGKPTLVDPKGLDFERYRGATVLTPNLAELEAIVGPCNDETALLEKTETLRVSLDVQAILVTRSEAGMTLIQAGSPPQHLAASAREVYDVTGAGDTVIAVMAGCLSAGLPLSESARFANQAAGIVVAKLGTASVTPAELRAIPTSEPRPSNKTGVMSESDLLVEIEQAKLTGQRVVMTNGCFDILHPGHVSYLQQASAQGDLLVVAVNDDDSVRRLKGPSRPVNPTADRMAILAALACVEFVVPFSEDTPARLIEAVAPDVLVKGGDYKVEEIAGHESVLARGGRVITLDFVEGHSTSGMLARLGK
ncbi:bifunctional D-glycero-beta-D-manno-heptose-7-phosphate kinase/D-glycero-beta-D-manno-heptose 1-phosphate adenylyltransferase HldE [Luminiphilus sp.]|jgi:D-beta-D-heptose 7-phosphate kinase/D-beta-D-heptose 1-phosphate adenosyltransferase|nr:bifunctional D-glycero-beta-D-manno-heptose-7-phosphate kinase/D-glycero-beta-D-manno-heptose 1-phosphate adenylyltransferase HldE [Halieaceae bacterium]MCH1579632.1 bifunctional D-glycero-beta-D-manno-heptose-7-phosphate kinase/D-glycero-beta-D-manno-heptose 1-phosphate adenylyltransferase HldE [Luminiphilus sp.]MDC0574072.1 bifunctional D-glycero-beta-D-manno-heptose-7-phosphate kinase/D-glycero-beta-D-manno-heptose 1-phosphate adenylyltransferase HldE [Luminiphilus sp.]MDC6472453.1 bifunct